MWQVGDACYATRLEAVQASVSSEIGKVVVVGSNSYTVDVTAVTDTTATYHLKRLTANQDFVPRVSTVTVQPCGLMTWQDGVQVGWMLIAAWAGAYAIRYLAKVVKP